MTVQLANVLHGRFVFKLAAQGIAGVGCVTQLAARYGMRAEAVITALGRRPLRHHADYSENEITFLIHNEQAVMPEDLLVRRTRIAISGKASVAQELGWSDDLLAQNIAVTCSRLVSLHRLTSLSSPADAEDTLYASNT